MFDQYDTRVQTVTDITRSIKGLLETHYSFVTVIGEISNLRKPHSGHLYFTLKDQGAQLRAVLFKTQQKYLVCEPEEGLEVICRGRLSVYEPRGEYQLIVDYIDFKGTGALQIAFEQLKQKLKEQGLFDEAHKRRLPFLPERVGLITSPHGAAVHDFLAMAAARFPAAAIEILPVRVQGHGAADEIAAALREMNERGTAEVIVLCRGGGSIEDLWAFNEEKVARAIFSSTIPVVSAIGHEVDFTIADFVADVRAPTPTAAAEAVLPDRRTLDHKLRAAEHRIGQTMLKRIADCRYRIDTARRLLRDPSFLLGHFRLILDHAQEAMQQAWLHGADGTAAQLERLIHRLLQQNPELLLVRHRQRTAEVFQQLSLVMRVCMARKRAELEKGAALLDAVSPLAVLGRGYAIVRTVPDGQVVRASSQVKRGETVTATLHQGRLDCEVTGIHDG